MAPPVTFVECMGRCDRAHPLPADTQGHVDCAGRCLALFPPR